MKRDKIYELIFDTINESREWNKDYKNNEYAYWIDGVLSLADGLLDECDDRN